MFPHAENRIGTFLRRSVDAAIDFATLGEYGLSSAMDADVTTSRLAPLPPRADVLSVALAPPVVPTAAGALAPVDVREAFRLQATSAAARRVAAVAAPAHEPVPHASRRVRGAVAAPAAHKSRKRAGSATRTEQLCFFID